MRKIKIGISKNINFKIKNYHKQFAIDYMKRKNFDFDVIIISPDTDLNYKDINKSKNIKLIFIMSLHKISKINLLKIRKDIDIIWFDQKSKKILKTITSTPEFIFGLIIILAKNFLNCQKLIENNIWSPRKTAMLSNEKMLSMSTLGIIGYGRIGKKLKQIAKSFKMKTLIYSKYHNEKNANLDSIAKKSDFVSVNLSLNDSTKNLIDRKFFKKMKKSSYFINTSKGAIVNYSHLLKYLGKNIKGAALDVYKVKDPNNTEIKRLCDYAKNNQNLILTPHIAGGTEDSIIKLQNHCLDMVKNYFKEKNVLYK